MATYNKFNSWVGVLSNGQADLASDTLMLGLSNTAPVATNVKWADITEIAAGNGYTAGGVALTSVTDTDTTGTVTLASADLNPAWTATGTIGPFRYAVLYDLTATVKAPALTVGTIVTSGGTFGATGTYYYRITATTAAGESTGSVEVSAVVAATTDEVPLSWSAIPNATGYKIYRSTTAGGETGGSSLLTTIASGSTTSYTDTGTATTSGSIPNANTATFKPLIGWWDYGSSISLLTGETFSWKVSGNANDGIFTLA